MPATTHNSTRTALGIDIAKKTFDAALLQGAKLSGGHFNNDAKGFVKLSRWIDDQGVDQSMEIWSEVVYGENLAGGVSLVDAETTSPERTDTPCTRIRQSRSDNQRSRIR